MKTRSTNMLGPAAKSVNSREATGTSTLSTCVFARRSIIPLMAIMFSSSCYPQGDGTQEDVSALVADGTCETCTLELTRLARIGSPDDSIYYFMDRLSVVRDSHGNIYLGPRTPPGVMAIDVYSMNGNHLRSLGHRGSGPDEFPHPYAFIRGLADTLIVFDDTRIGFVDASRGAVGRILVPLAGSVIDAIHLPSGGLVLNADLHSVEAAGLPLHLIAPSGQIVRSFGADPPEVRPDRPFESWRRIALASDTALWSIPLNRYEIELWSLGGVRHRVLRREASWFKPWVQPAAYLTERPSPRIMGIHYEEDSGLLWVLLNVADQDWQPIPIEDHQPLSTHTFHSLLTKVFDSVVEVIDPKTRRVVMSQRWPEYFLGLDRDKILYSPGDDTLGIPYINVWELQMRTREQ